MFRPREAFHRFRESSLLSVLDGISGGVPCGIECGGCKYGLDAGDGEEMGRIEILICSIQVGVAYPAVYTPR